MKLCNRSPMYLLFIGIQHFFLSCIVIGMFIEPVKRDPELCADKAGLLMVQITTAIDIGVKGTILILMFVKDRFASPPEMIGKAIGCFITTGIFLILCAVCLITGSVTIQKSAYYLFFQGLGFANEGAFHVYHRRTYKP